MIDVVIHDFVFCSQAIKDAEVYLEECRVKAESAREKLEQVMYWYNNTCVSY